nr:hypothetical protein [Shewanella sp.]
MPRILGPWAGYVPCHGGDHAKAIIGQLTEFDLFAGMKHIRLPMNECLGNLVMAMGMTNYRMMEHFR